MFSFALAVTHICGNKPVAFEALGLIRRNLVKCPTHVKTVAYTALSVQHYNFPQQYVIHIVDEIKKKTTKNHTHAAREHDFAKVHILGNNIK